MSPDHITAGTYNLNIDKRLARNMIWLRENSANFCELRYNRYDVFVPVLLYIVSFEIARLHT